MKFLIATLLATVALAGPARADDVTQRKGFLGADFELLPNGSITIGSGNNNNTNDAQAATAVGVIAETQVDELVTVGLAPRYVFGINAKNSTGDSSSQLDLRARVTVGGRVGVPKLRVYGFGEPGWSIVFIPQSVRLNNQSYHPNGFVINAGGGLSYELSSSLRGYFELGYQWGFQGTTINVTAPPLPVVTADVTASDNFFQLGFGLQAALD
jgi:hypothetical protein